MLDNPDSPNGGRGQKSANGGRKTAKRAAKAPAKGAAKRRSTSAAMAALSADPADADVSIEVSDESGTASRARGRGGDDVGGPSQRRGSRERSLHRLLAGLRAVNAGDFTVRLTANGDPLMADIIDVFNSVTQKQGRLVEEISRVSTSVGREGKMRDRVSLQSAGGQWSQAVESVNSLITDLVQPTSE